MNGQPHRGGGHDGEVLRVVELALEVPLKLVVGERGDEDREPNPCMAITEKIRLTRPIQKPAWPSRRFFGVSPASTRRTPLRPSTMPAIDRPTESSVERPAEISSRPPPTSDRMKPATAWLLSGTRCG